MYKTCWDRVLHLMAHPGPLLPVSSTLVMHYSLKRLKKNICFVRLLYVSVIKYLTSGNRWDVLRSVSNLPGCNYFPGEIAQDFGSGADRLELNIRFVWLRETANQKYTVLIKFFSCLLIDGKLFLQSVTLISGSSCKTKQKYLFIIVIMAKCRQVDKLRLNEYS